MAGDRWVIRHAEPPLADRRHNDDYSMNVLKVGNEFRIDSGVGFGLVAYNAFSIRSTVLHFLCVKANSSNCSFCCPLWLNMICRLISYYHGHMFITVARPSRSMILH